MNNERAQSVDIIFNRGLRQDLDPHTAPPGTLVTAQNLEFDQLGRLVKRDGFAVVGQTAISKSYVPTTQVRRFAQAPDGTRLFFSDDNAWQYLPAQNKVTSAIADGVRHAMRASMTDARGIVADDCGNIKFADAIAVGSWSVYLYVQADATGGGFSVWSHVIDTVSKARVVTRKLLGTSVANYPPRLVVSGGSSVVFALWAETGGATIQYARLDLGTTPIAWGAAATLLTSGVPAIFDADTMASGWVLVYYNAEATKPQVNTYNSTPSLQNSVLWSASGGGAWTPSALTVSGDWFAGSKVHAAGYNTGAFKLEGAVFSTTLTLVAQGSVDPGLDHGAPVRQLAIGRTSSTKTLVAFSNHVSNNAPDNPRGHLYFYELTDAAALSSLYTLGYYSLASRIYVGSVAGTNGIYVVARFDDPSGFQNHFLLVDLGASDGVIGITQPAPVCHFASGRVPLKDENAVTGIGGIVDLGSGTFQFAAVTNIGASQYSGNQIQAWTFQNRGAQRYLSTPCQHALVVGGGTPLIYDGEKLAELSFYSYPVLQSGNVTPSASGGSIARGVYQYRAVYEWCDSRGNRHQSPASPAFTVDLSSATYAGGTNSVAFAMAAMQATLKMGDAADTNASIQVVFYRTLAGEPIFYRVPGGAANHLFTTADSTFTDTYPDLLISRNEPIYTNNGGQGLLASTAPPPSIVLTTHAGRLWGVDCENPERIWCTRTLREDEGPSYSPALQILIPGAGRINGLAGQDGKLYALATNGIYLASYGDGPDDTGQGAFPSPELITTTARCTDPRGVLVGQDGIYFTGDDQWGTGIYMIRRGDGTPISIGKRVRGAISTNPICVGAVDRIGKARTEFYMTDSDTAPVTSKLLYYHHDYLDEEGIGQWTTAFQGNGVAIGVWDDQTVIATDDVTFPVLWQKVGTTQDAGFSFTYLLSTADIRPAGLLGFAQVSGVSMLGTQVSADPVMIEISYDSGFSWPDVYQWTASTETADQPVIRRREPATQKQFDGSTIRVRLSNPTLGGSAPGSTYFHGISIELAPLGGGPRLNTARRS